MSSEPQMLIPIAQILREPQVPHDLELDLDVTEDWRTEYAHFVPGIYPLDLTVTASDGGVLVHAQTELDYQAECSRCVTEFEVPVEIELSEYYTTEARVAAALKEGDEDAENWPTHNGESFDLLPRLREEAILALPLLPLCEPDCEGLCADCGEPYRDLPEDHEHEVLDPRMAALKDFFKDSES
ncbi:YceD family protein [Boudabousia liubingyangii]|uniref:YceD family protein n=1 Tax=Boudabousia liubingyangii TaxID=1921764 RepID=UPI0009FB7582|nr:YceD family protein [Boudabousia liubingyangii]